MNETMPHDHHRLWTSSCCHLGERQSAMAVADQAAAEAARKPGVPRPVGMGVAAVEGAVASRSMPSSKANPSSASLGKQYS
mmetsp:Transcript_30466/g.97456  ORF Transcript_30466/g.97456 Transcript_30466/m.97456 type:complete len:81 (-) Transcript_30466:1012-1254(-)